MSVWDVYQDKITMLGGNKHDAVLTREVRNLNAKLKDNLSYQSVDIYKQDCGYNITSPEMAEKVITQNVAIVDSDNLDEKYIYSLPGEDLEHGSLIYWDDNYWLITERDANTTVYTRGILTQCNYLLKWVLDGEIYEQWCIVEDGTKYLTGEYEDRDFIVTRGDSRIAVTIAKNELTSQFTRKNRFLIDDIDSPIMLSYILSKPLKLGHFYNGKGVYKFVLQEVTGTVYDNHDLGIADYYLHFPEDESGEEPAPDIPDASNGKKVWL